MVVGAFPLFKLVSLAVKQVSKPVATSLKTAAKQSEFFRKYVCVWPGQGKLILLKWLYFVEPEPMYFHGVASRWTTQKETREEIT